MSSPACYWGNTGATMRNIRTIRPPFPFPLTAMGRADNLMLTTTSGTTVAVEYAIDSETGVLTEVWSHGREEALYSAALGEVQELDSGGHLVSFGMGALVQGECGGRGDMVFTGPCG